MDQPEHQPEFRFTGTLWHWRGPSPYYFVRVPAEPSEDLAELGPDVTYGWGMIPVEVTIGDRTWETSLWPKDGGYLVPIRAKIRRELGLEIDDPVEVRFAVATRDGRFVSHEPPE